MKLEVLISCMYQEDSSVADRTGITTDALIINQCDRENRAEELRAGGTRIRRIDTKARGLSNSRNMAMENAEREICLICDDDETFEKQYAEIITDAFSGHPEADVMIFLMSNHPCKLKKVYHKLSRLELLHVSSVQIAFRREAVLKAGVRFDPYMGAGSGNGGGEEIKFVTDCWKAGLSIYHFPAVIGSVAHEDSTWFQGYDRRFFYDRGASTRYMMGLPLSVLYGFYYVVAKRGMYRETLSPAAALKSLLQGISEDRIGRQKREKLHG